MQRRLLRFLLCVLFVPSATARPQPMAAQLGPHQRPSLEGALYLRLWPMRNRVAAVEELDPLHYGSLRTTCSDAWRSLVNSGLRERGGLEQAALEPDRA